MRKQKKKPKANERKRSANWDKKSQKLKLDLKSTHGRSRYLLSFLQKIELLIAFALVVYLGVLGVQFYQSWQVEPKIVEPVEMPDIVISGNSSLPSSEIESMVIQIIQPKLALIDPFEVKRVLEANGQVKHAKVEKDFPNQLKIDITERLPVLMLAALDEHNQLTFWAIDEEGIVYKPFDLQRMKALNLPFVEGVDLETIEDGVTFIDGVDKVHFLMQLLKQDVYAVYNDIGSVSLLHYNEGEAELGAIITLHGKQLKKIIFGVENFEYQVVKLIGVLSVAGKIRLNEKNVIDLSYSGDAIVR